MVKAEQFPYKLKFLDKNGIKPYLDYVISKYGEDFTKLYGSDEQRCSANLKFVGT